jgi:hypothetical protein
MDFIWIKRFVQSILLFVKEGDEFEKSIGDFLLDWFDNPYIDLQTLEQQVFLK